MPMIQEKDRQTIQQLFAERLVNPVRLVMFTQATECPYCEQTRQLAEEVASLADPISLEVYDFTADLEQVQAFGIDKTPAIAILGTQDYGVRYYGIPAGHEFATFIEDIVDVSAGAADLQPETQAALAQVQQPVHIQVFVTPT
jgi:glutaredoxin-like protein